jgi:REP element-mobilizing transposase RayT
LRFSRERAPDSAASWRCSPRERANLGKRQNFVGHFWARGYFVSTAGRDEETVREYIKTQEQEDKRLDQMNMWMQEPPRGGSK